jgi:hypothetical protein
VFSDLKYQLEITFSQPVDKALFAANPVIQVTLDLLRPVALPNVATLGSIPGLVSPLFGTFTLSEDGLRLLWTLAQEVRPAVDIETRMSVEMRSSLRVHVRVHCWALHAVNNPKRVFSAAADALGFPAPHLPGGVLESWFFLGGAPVVTPGPVPVPVIPFIPNPG